jgi:polysaccharide pyruvyl transferase WcaK-like protein
MDGRRTRPRRLLGRREFLAAGAVAAAAAASAGSDRPRRILLRSSWQTVNIGDIAHTPGLLAILERRLPGVEVTLWPSRIDDGVEDLLRRRFPRLWIAVGRAALDAAFAECDMLLHGSGPSLVAERDVARWCEQTGKPFGVYGITLPRTGSTSTSPTSDEVLRQTVSLLDRAKFVYFRDSVSLGLARDLGCTCPVMGFGPDGAFGTDLRDDASATAFLAAHRLEEGRFLCCIPRLRYTPYWEIPGSTKPFDPVKHARNEALKEHDHAPLRDAITAVVRETGLSVLVCPEDRTQMAVGRALLVDPLPPDVRSRVVWREHYWLPDEALSVYVRSAGLFGNEMHSPIMCIGNGVPALVCRWAEQTSKGIMWRDIGLGDWLFDFDDEADVRRLPAAVLAVARDPVAARRTAAAARAEVEQRVDEAMRVVMQALEQKA